MDGTPRSSTVLLSTAEHELQVSGSTWAWFAIRGSATRVGGFGLDRGRSVKVLGADPNAPSCFGCVLLFLVAGSSRTGVTVRPRL
jgi:hypothetical protein